MPLQYELDQPSDVAPPSLNVNKMPLKTMKRIQFNFHYLFLTSTCSGQRRNCMMSIFLNLLRPSLWLHVWSILENVECVLMKNVCVGLECSVYDCAATAAKSLQSCPTLCDPRDGSPPGSPVPGILHARTLEWVVIFSSNAWKCKLKVKSLSHSRLLATPWTEAYQAPLSMDFPGKSTGVGCHCLLLMSVRSS